jgi:hypothetical protein
VTLAASLRGASQPLDELLQEERAQYDAAVAAGPALPAGAAFDLGMRIVLVRTYVAAICAPAGRHTVLVRTHTSRICLVCWAELCPPGTACSTGGMCCTGSIVFGLKTYVWTDPLVSSI